MIEHIDNPIPGVSIYSVERDEDLIEPAGLVRDYLTSRNTKDVLLFPMGEFVEIYEEEANRTWPHLPFFPNLVGDANYADTFWSPVVGIEKAQQSRLVHIAMRFKVLNAVIEECIADYRTFYDIKWERSTRCEVIKIRGKQFSASLTVHETKSSTTTFIALTDLIVRLTRFDTEFPIAEGQVFVAPIQFPYDLQVKPPESNIAYFLTKSLYP
ncbi:MAG: hypothetical protein CL489_01095 [Acidobacteria bacterium]|jgi:hypothetical protein|nr:hypothetical protein [Acidobacteriota bacterium]|tara:strand:- start:56 stop:691 length:636 start_codon:yes stop_codon:yes gene_type:complete